MLNFLVFLALWPPIRNFSREEEDKFAAGKNAWEIFGKFFGK